MQKLLATSEGFLFFLSALVELIAFVRGSTNLKMDLLRSGLLQLVCTLDWCRILRGGKKKLLHITVWGKKKGVRA